MLNTIERRREIVLLTEKQGRVSVTQLSEKFDVSSVSIRNDLNELSKRGLLVRSRGGAIVNSGLNKELSIKDKHKTNQKVKQLLGRKVAELIDDGDSIILDSGTTTEEVAHCLTDKNDLTVMTNGLNIANELLGAENCDVFITGGHLRKKSMSFYDAQFNNKFKHYNFNKVILGVDGLDINKGISTHFEPEAIYNRAMCEHADIVIAVTDSSKFGKTSLHSILPLESIDILVTDSNIPKEFIDKLKELNIELLIVNI